MGQLVDGKWKIDPPRESGDGKFKRAKTHFRNWITPDGDAGPTGMGGFPAAAGRYHIYVSLACPWAHRTLVVRKLKGLEEQISVSSCAAFMGDHGWEFTDEFPDPLYKKKYVHELYQKADAGYTGRASVPVLWDKERETIVSNESAEIIRMLNSAFDGLGADASVDLYPAALRAEIDRINSVVYDTVNNGVYKSGFATTQAAYEEAATALFVTLDELEERLSRQRYLVGERPTEADWRLFTTLVRFDPVYVGHFKCNIRRLADYANLSNYLRDLYQVPGIAETVHIDYIKEHYYRSHTSVNPTGIVPIGPEIDLKAPHNRERLQAA
ncbi:glutathione S-transferase family protein [Microbaculum marinum]|uniref:Glutathione S-transferase family protein n=1 Tax=Microbaculum marinum TaxID=1764581 RepID=A0AAW9RET9_9HYPH